MNVSANALKDGACVRRMMRAQKFKHASVDALKDASFG
jgi:hypothetical protein